MILAIDTTKNNIIAVSVKDGKKSVIKKKFASAHRQAEDLLPAIDKTLKAKGLKLAEIEKIQVANQGGSFTSLRIGAVTANALAYALGIEAKGMRGKEKKIGRRGKFRVVEPYYNAEPRITKKLQGQVATRPYPTRHRGFSVEKMLRSKR